MLGDLGRGAGHTFKEGFDADTGVPAAISATTYFKKIALANEKLCAIQINYNEDSTATLAGTFKVQGSNFDNPTDQAAGTREWLDLDVVFSASSVIVAGAGMIGVSMDFIGWRWIRVVFTRTGGTGSVGIRTVQKTV